MASVTQKRNYRSFLATEFMTYSVFFFLGLKHFLFSGSDFAKSEGRISLVTLLSLSLWAYFNKSLCLLLTCWQTATASCCSTFTSSQPIMVLRKNVDGRSLECRGRNSYNKQLKTWWQPSKPVQGLSISKIGCMCKILLGFQVSIFKKI